MDYFLDLDRKWSLHIHQKGLSISRFWLRALEYSGDGTFWLPVTAGIWLAPVVKQSLLRSFFLNLFAAFVFDLLLIGLIKTIVRRRRPVYNKAMYVVLSADQWSFPSGHSSRALLIATLYLLHFPLWRDMIAQSLLPYFAQNKNPGAIDLASWTVALAPCISFLVFTWAAATAFSRILLGRHYCCDVLVGSVLGILEAILMHRSLSISANSSEAFRDSIRSFVGAVYNSLLNYMYG